MDDDDAVGEIDYNDRDKAALTKIVETTFATSPKPIEILEIGGGRVSRLGYGQARFTILEVSEDSLGSTPYASETIIGDIESVDLGDRRFDAVVFFNVLEHVGRPTLALERSAALLRAGGLLIVVGPELNSLKGLVTRFTPHWVHVAFYRQVLRRPSAGTPGHAPFPTHLAQGASPREIATAATGAGCALIYDERYLGPTLSTLRAKKYPLYLLYTFVNTGLRIVTFGSLGSRTADFVLVFKRG